MKQRSQVQFLPEPPQKKVLAIQSEPLYSTVLQRGEGEPVRLAPLAVAAHRHMIQYDLKGADPEFERACRETYAALMDKYPFVPLKSVSLYEPRGDDTSMGVTYPDGRIEFNRYWFAGGMDRLDDAAKRDVLVDADGTPIAWHGDMVDEPVQVLTHEFFHCLALVLPEYKDWAKRAHLEATLHPELSPSGYAFANADEFWAEAMASRELGFTFGALASLETFLRVNLPAQ